MSFSTTQKLRTHSKIHQSMSGALLMFRTCLMLVLCVCLKGDRYACPYETCRLVSDLSTSQPTLSPSTSSSIRYFSTWSDLQRHLRSDHPPTCPHAECGGQTFTAQKGLRAHMRIHEEKEREKDMLDLVVEGTEGVVEGEDEDGDNGNTVALEGAARRKKKKTRRGGEVGRDWACSVVGCAQAFKSVSALSLHRSYLFQPND